MHGSLVPCMVTVVGAVTRVEASVATLVGVVGVFAVEVDFAVDIVDVGSRVVGCAIVVHTTAVDISQ